MSKMLDSMSEELGDVQFKLGAAREKAATANTLVETLEREERALQAALDILTGKAQVPASVEPTIPRELVIAALQGLGASAVGADDIRAKRLEGVKPQHDITFNLPEGWTQGVLNGETIPLEPGFEIGTNSFGEQCIVKKGIVHTPMAEPVVPENQGLGLPPITEDYENFSDAELLDG